MKCLSIATLGFLGYGAAFVPGNSAFNRMSVATNMSSADFVKQEIAANDVVVFSKSYCPYCKKTKELFNDLKVDATIFELNEMDDGADIQDALLDLTGQRTVPNVFIKGEHIGGNDACQAAAKAGSLQKKLGL
jgi:glutaredoxin 3